MTSTKAPEAERALLGCMMVEHSAVVKAHLHLASDDFDDPLHKYVFNAAMRLLEAHPNDGIDIVTMAAELRRAEKLESIGGMPFLLDLTHSVQTAAHVDHYAKEVKKASLHRQITASLKRTHEDRTSDNLAQLHDLMYQLSSLEGDELYSFSENLMDTLDAIAADKEPGILTGFGTIDSMMMGAERGDLITVGGRTGLGKTALMVRMLCNMAQEATEGKDMRPGENFLYMTAEMKVDSIVKRIMPMAARIPAERFKRKTLTQQDISTMVDVTGETLSQLPIKMYCRPFISIDHIRTSIMKAKARVAFVDYLQRCKKPKAENMAYAIEQFMAQLKTTAQETGCTIFLGVQLDRGLDREKDRPPVLADMKGSSAIEAESDGVLLLWEPSAKYIAKKWNWMPAAPGQTAIDCIIAKGRSNKTGVACLQMDKEYVQFSDRIPPPGYKQGDLEMEVESELNH